mgnify:CR=1 FL=1
MIPVIDFQSNTVLEEIREAYTTVGFAVFTNTLNSKDQQTMCYWFDYMKQFFELDLVIKQKYSYQVENNLQYSAMGAENLNTTDTKDMNENFKYNHKGMPETLWH